MSDACQVDDWVKLEGAFTRSEVHALRQLGHIEKLSITKGPRITVRLAECFPALHSVDWVWLWRDVTRRALREFLRIPGLRVLDVLMVTPPGTLDGFAITSLEVLRASFGLTESELLEVGRCQTLRELGAQNASLSLRALETLLELPGLRSLDLEATRFDDEMAHAISKSKRIESLDVGATKLSGRGLSFICQMQQLRSLDLWAAPIEAKDVELLKAVPNLEYVSIGDHEGGTRYSADDLLPTLMELPSLQRIWLDGVAITQAQQKQLEERFSSVRITR
jgi:hypothetical protein